MRRMRLVQELHLGTGSEHSAARWHALRLQALAQGMADAGIQLRWETERRPEAFRWPKLGDGYLYGMVVEASRMGRGLMPRYGDKVRGTDRWDVVNYVRSLQVLARGPQ